MCKYICIYIGNQCIISATMPFEINELEFMLLSSQLKSSSNNKLDKFRERKLYFGQSVLSEF